MAEACVREACLISHYVSVGKFVIFIPHCPALQLTSLSSLVFSAHFRTNFYSKSVILRVTRSHENPDVW